MQPSSSALILKDFPSSVQFNPKRITSSAAKVDKESIEKRPCFLCVANRPSEQVGVEFGMDYEILCNPYPIFRKHFTIAKTEHTPQVIDGEFSRFLDLSKALPEFAVFYNAPGCGASAPDHMHFQAGSRDFMPIRRELPTLVKMYGFPIIRSDELRVTAVNDGLRRFYLLESEDGEWLEGAFLRISGFMRDVSGGEEPMLNMLAYYDTGWKILVFPRGKHRPWQFFEEGEKNILISPASVDMGGTMITPLEKDFTRISREDIVDIYTQISFPEGQFNQLNQLLKEHLYQ